MYQSLWHSLGYEKKCNLFNLTKSILVLSWFWLIQQSSSRSRCWNNWIMSLNVKKLPFIQHLIFDNDCCIIQNVDWTRIDLVTLDKLCFFHSLNYVVNIDISILVLWITFIGVNQAKKNWNLWFHLYIKHYISKVSSCHC